MSKQSRLLTVAVLSVVIAAFLWWGYMAPAGTYFELYDREHKEQLLITPVKAGDELRLEIEHSAEFIPWFEYYTVLSDGSFNLHSIAVAGYGAGIPAEMDVSHRIEDGLVWMEGINSVFPEFKWITSDTYMKGLTLNGEEIFDFRTLPNKSRVRGSVIMKRGYIS
ncbi:MAG: DUF1850 domain-containing protein [Oscillospiraceae bacterium]|nr:DUF1850 domain-containing protein [Oscillospiraceae bacterium]